MCRCHRYKDSGRLHEAEKSYRQALALQPDNAVVMGNLAAVELELGRPEQSLVTFKRALELKPDFPDALSNMANALKVLGRTEEAIAGYQKVLALDPRHADALNNLANVYKDQGASRHLGGGPALAPPFPDTIPPDPVLSTAQATL